MPEVLNSETPLRYTVWLDALDDQCATYRGANQLQVVIDRAAFDNNGNPLSVNVMLNSHNSGNGA